MNRSNWLSVALIGVAFIAWCRGMALRGDELCGIVVVLCLLLSLSIYIWRSCGQEVGP
jgi:Flp pilus assembly protein protease CpaA